AFRGDLSPAIGQLTEMVELYLGTHNDTNLISYDPTLDSSKSLAERNRTRLESHGEYLRTIHPATQFAEPCARALAENNIHIAATSLYDTMSEGDIIDRKSGAQRIHKMDTNHGTMCNGLKSIPAEIGKLTKLQYLFIANGALETLPEELGDLVSCTDLELYNCSKLKKFPLQIARMPELISINISNNRQWSASEIYAGMDALACGASKEKIQILYARQNSLEELPESFKNMTKVSLLDLAYNNISKIHPLGKSVSPVQLYLDNNQLESLPVDEEGYFCGYADSEAFSVKYNKLKKVPNIFSAKSNSSLTSVDFSGNEIDGFEGEEDGSYRGIKVETFTLAQNPKLTKYPTALAKTNSIVAYIILRGCSIDEIPKGSFEYENSIYMTSIDLSYNKLKDLPREIHAVNLPYLYGVELSFNCFEHFPFEPLDSFYLTVLGIRSQRNAAGERCLREWPQGVFNHKGLRGLYLGSNDLRKIDDTISTLIYYLDISDNPNIIFDASDICYAWQVGAYMLIYDKSQTILNCDAMLE
ncbi:MAG: leucine-rich repeat domain-containing protein, partial [Alistipes sp.]|nr:leucine-rich repeat domain-containing protein [Alistipes sp.]